MQEYVNRIIKDLAKECKTVEDVHEMMKNLFKDTIQEVFEAEIDTQLGYKKHSSEGDNIGKFVNFEWKNTLEGMMFICVSVITETSCLQPLITIHSMIYK